MQTRSPVDRTTAAKSSFVIVGLFACLGCVFLLIAATIVLALIPIFIPNKDATQDPNAKRTDPIQLQLALNDDNTTGYQSRRKRELNDSYTDCTFGPTGLSIIRSKLFVYVKNPVVRDIVMLNTSIITAPTTSSYTYLLNVFFYITFIDSCAYKCQLNNVESIYSSIANGTVSGKPITGIDLYKDGTTFGYLSFSVAVIYYLSTILPALSASSPVYATASSLNTTNNTNNTGTGR